MKFRMRFRVSVFGLEGLALALKPKDWKQLQIDFRFL